MKYFLEDMIREEKKIYMRREEEKKIYMRREEEKKIYMRRKKQSWKIRKKKNQRRKCSANLSRWLRSFFTLVLCLGVTIPIRYEQKYIFFYFFFLRELKKPHFN